MGKKTFTLEMICVFVIFSNVVAVLQNTPIHNGSDAQIAILDIGQGDATLLRTQSGKYGLIDTGKSSSIIKKLEENIPLGVNSIEFLILTHPDLDHIGMFTEISKRYEIRNLFINKTTKVNNALNEIKDNILAENIHNLGLFESNDFYFEEFFIDVVWPIENTSSRDFESNEYSISTIISLNDFDFATFGDLGSYIEDDLYNYLPDEKTIDILKLSHHGSKNSSSEEFLKAVNPKIAIVSAGEKNSYGHPHEDVIEKLEKMGIKLYSTIEDDDIFINIDKSGNYSIE